MADPRHQLGGQAEEAVAAWLSGRGWRILARRWRWSGGELDLVCLDAGGVLVGVEVKVRRTDRAGSGAESVDRRRLARLRTTLARYARTSGLAADGLRIDLVSLRPAAGGRWLLERLPAVDRW